MAKQNENKSLIVVPTRWGKGRFAGKYANLTFLCVRLLRVFAVCWVSYHLTGIWK